MRCLIQNNDKDGQKKEWDHSDLIHVLYKKCHLAKQLPQLHIILFSSLFFPRRLVTFTHSLVHSLRQQWLLNETPAEELKQASCSRVVVNNSLKYSHTWIKRAKNSKRKAARETCQHVWLISPCSRFHQCRDFSFIAVLCETVQDTSCTHVFQIKSLPVGQRALILPFPPRLLIWNLFSVTVAWFWLWKQQSRS